MSVLNTARSGLAHLICPLLPSVIGCHQLPADLRKALLFAVGLKEAFCPQPSAFGPRQ